MNFRTICNLYFVFLERVLFRRNFLILGKEAKISKKAFVSGARINGNVVIGDYCKIIDGVSLKTASKIVIGHHSSINGPNTDIFSNINEVRIGSYSSIARNVTMQEFNHNLKTITTYHIRQNVFGESKKNDIYSNGPIIIGNDVWIGAQCVILSGARIGNGAIVAANSVVVSEVPPYSIVGGSPAKVLKYRFDQETINLLEQIKWWDWSLDKIKANSDLFNGDLDKEKLRILLNPELC